MPKLSSVIHMRACLGPYLRLSVFLIANLFAPLDPAAQSASGGSRPAVFVSGQEGFHTYRIPSLVRASNGDLIAICEARKDRGDQAGNELVFKRSSDEGMTWTGIGFIDRAQGRSLNNPCSLLVHSTSEILVMYQAYPPGIAERSVELKAGWEGTNIVRTFLVRSHDHGKSWSLPEDVTTSVKRRQVATTMSSGPGIGIQLENGPYAGRLLIPFNEGPYEQWNVYAAISDDQGRTWRQGERVPGGVILKAVGGTGSIINEAQIAELSDGSVLLNMRSWGKPRLRKASISRDGGRTWSLVEEVPDLPEPSCQSSILRCAAKPDGVSRPLLAYSGPFGPERRNGVLLVSRDDGKSWRQREVIEPGRFAYSCLAGLRPGRLACLFETGEKDPYERIQLRILDVE